MLTSVACQQWQLFCLLMLTHTLSTDILYLPNPLLIVLDKGGGVNPYGQPGGKIYVFLLTTSQSLQVDGVDDCVGWARNLVFIASAAGTEFLAVGSADFNYLQTQSSRPSKIIPAAAVNNPITISRQSFSANSWGPDSPPGMKSYRVHGDEPRWKALHISFLHNDTLSSRIMRKRGEQSIKFLQFLGSRR